MSDYEKRTMERFGLQLSALITGLGADHESPVELTTNDICAGGAFFKTDNPLPVGSDVSINLVLPLDKFQELKASEIKVKVTGLVLRSTPEGMAVVFDKGFEIVPLNDPPEDTLILKPKN